MTHRAWTDFVKVGMTSMDPSLRARQITSVSGLIAPCQIYHCIYVSDRRLAERAVHHVLDEFRIRRGRELFRVSPGFAARVLDEVHAMDQKPQACSGIILRTWIFLILFGLTCWYFIAACFGIVPFPFLHAGGYALVDGVLIGFLVWSGLRMLRR